MSEWRGMRQGLRWCSGCKSGLCYHIPNTKARKKWLAEMRRRDRLVDSSPPTGADLEYIRTSCEQRKQAEKSGKDSE